MAELFNITLESGNLIGTPDSFDAAVVAGGDLSVEHAAALACTCQGLNCLIDDQVAMYGRKNQGWPASGELRFRFYIDPNGLAMGGGDAFRFLLLDASDWEIWLEKPDPLFQLSFDFVDDAGDHWDDFTITDAPHYIECHLERATGPAANNGRYRVWLDGVLQMTKDILDNWDTLIAGVDFYFGPSASLDIGTSGILYLDELRANDDGSEIGPVAGGYLGSMMRLGVGGRKD